MIPAMNQVRVNALLMGLGLLFVGCSDSKDNPLKSQTQATRAEKPHSTNETSGASIHFSDMANISGVTWVARNGEEGGMFGMLESFGSGCAVDDYDLDDRLDLIFAGGGVIGPGDEIRPLPIGLFRQLETWRYTPVTQAAGLQPIRHYNHGIWTADSNDDGFSDLLITGWGGLQLFRNQGDGTYIDITDAAGLRDPLWSLAAAWADLNQDQVLDLFVGHYVDWSPQNNPICKDAKLGQRNVCDPPMFRGLPCMVYLGNGDGTYRDGSDELGIHEVGKTLGVVIADIDDDGRPDVYVANDTLPNHLYQATSSGAYREVGLRSGVALGENASADGSMGVEVGDLNADGKLDYWVANFEKQTFALYTNLGHGLFNHSSRAFGVTAVGSEAVGFGTIIFDADGDGYSDIFCANGHVWVPNPVFDRRQLPYLFWNDHGKRLVNVAKSAGDYFTQKHLGRGAAQGDLDGNGTPDLAVTHTNEPVAILRNDVKNTNWLAIRLVGRKSPRSAICARVTIQTAGITQTATIKGGGSYLSTSEQNLLFGLGVATTIDSIDVTWPSGQRTRLNKIAAGQKLLLVEDND